VGLGRSIHCGGLYGGLRDFWHVHNCLDFSVIPIDPIAALDGLQNAISMVKKASKVANDLGGLAPMIGKMFDARSTATKAMIEAKRSKKGSNMGTALQIEMVLEQARAFEEELKMLFMTTGKIDVWNKIKARQAAMDLADAKEMKALRLEEKKQKEDEEEQTVYLVAGLAIVFLVSLIAFGLTELQNMCGKAGCGR
jgi:hypothetical protein